MSTGKFDWKETQSYWIDSSDKDFRTMNNLFKSKDYSWALFVGHLVIEKLLKACYVSKRQEHAPMIHNLLKSCEGAGIEASQHQKEGLDIITSFNLSSRYDSYNRNFIDVALNHLLNIGSLK